MSKVEFSFLDKSELDLLLPYLFEILHSNMTLIAPTGNSYNADYNIWCSNIIPAIKKEQRQIVLMYSDSTLAGYFQYYINADTNSLMMEEIQIKNEFQGTGLFSEFYRWMIKQLPDNLLYAEAYANKKNYRSMGILEHLGLIRSGENNNGNSFYYKGSYADFIKKYKL